MIRAAAKQVAALPWRSRDGRLEILLVTSRETRRWIVPKGWPIPDLVAAEAAGREAWEEAGVEGTVRRRPIGRFTYEKRRKNGAHTPCSVSVYALCVESEHASWPESTQRERCWFAVDEALEKITETDLRALIRAFASSF